MNEKYPRTHHVPWSQSNTSDDVWWPDCAPFEGKEVIVTEKMDGECTGMTQDLCHARSLDSRHHPSRSWVKGLHGQIRSMIPDGWKIFGENLFAFHSIFYTDLPSYFLVFGIYDENNMCLSWDDTEELCKMLGLHTVPVLYRGVWDAEKVRTLWTGKGTFPTFGTQISNPTFPDDFVESDAEGYVARLVDSFHYDAFRQNCAKYVRPNHVTTSSHWMEGPVVPNLLAENTPGQAS